MKRNKLISILTLTTILSVFSGCGKKVECNINEEHAHIYVNEEGYVRDIESEREQIGDFRRTEDYSPITETDSKKLSYAFERDLLPIESNIEKLTELESKVYDYTEYEYEETYFSPIYINDIMYVNYITESKYSKDPGVGNKTGNERTVSHKFIGYNVIIDEKETPRLIKSEPMDSIEDLINNGYTYVSENKIYYGYNKETKEFIDYNDEMGEKLNKTLELK